MSDAAPCHAFNALASETWAQIELGSQSGYGSPDERSFTDHHLLELMRLCPGRVAAAKFDQNREAETAADVEWWLGDGAEFLGMRVQAKKLDPSTDSYEELGHHIGTGHELQIDRLITSAGEEGMIPLYLFFNGPSRVGWPDDRCPNRDLEPEHRGCTVALASEVRDSLRGDAGSLDLDDIAPLSWPWQCLVCCAETTARGQVGRALDVLRQGRLSSVDPVPIDEPPSYVRDLLTPGETKGGQPDLPGAATVMVTSFAP